MAKSSKSKEVFIPINDELSINKFARNAICSIFLEADFFEIVKLSRDIHIIEKIIRAANVLIKNDKFIFEYLDDNTENSIEKLKLFNPTFRMVDEEYLDSFLERHDYKDSDEDSFYKIGYECGDDYMLVDLPKWTILVRNVLAT